MSRQWERVLYQKYTIRFSIAGTEQTNFGGDAIIWDKNKSRKIYWQWMRIGLKPGCI